VLPKLTSATELGATATAAYARRDGLSIGDYLERVGPRLTPEDVGMATVDLVSADYASGAYLLTPAGLTSVG
jgi:hypothetical protein